MTTDTIEVTPPERSFGQRMLDGIERVGNRIPHPAMLFVYLIVGVIILSQILYFLNVKATYETVAPPPQATHQSEYYGAGSTKPIEVVPEQPAPAKDYKVQHETTKVSGLLTGNGVRHIFTAFVSTFQNFSAMALILVVMIGVGLAEEAGLIAALVRKLVAVAPPSGLAFIIVLIGVVSSIASDAGYLVLIPLGAAAYLSVGRHPLAGMAAGFAGVSAGFGVNFLITPIDTVLTEITNEAIHLTDPSRTIDLTANLWFGIFSTILVAIVGALITTWFVERSLGKYDPSEAGEASAEAGEESQVTPEAESRGLRFALLGLIGVVIGIALLTAIPGAPLRNPETGSVIGDSPFMDSLVFVIMIVFFVCGFCFARGAGTIKGSTAIINAITKQWQTLAGMLLLFLLIAQFLDYFSYSNIATVAAVKLGDLVERANVGGIWLLVLFILVTAVIDLILTGAVGQWAIFAPIFIPLFLRLNISPATVLAAYRLGDSPLNVITPAMAYFPLIVIFAQRYRKSAGIGTVIAMMIPYALILLVVWGLFFIIWYLLGIPLGPGAPIHL
ncbi:MAG TPA: AbgT family transporter [Solirubrobacteraceae bacterium]|nr:AbgT family transporter [Solirubrobacteraceae bacterium]